MLKKFVCLILSVFMVFTLAACNLFEHNYERDYKQVVAKIDPISETQNGKSFTYKGKEIYKYELVNMLNANAQSMISEQGYTLEKATQTLLDQLITRELVLIDVERKIQYGEMKWRWGDESKKLDDKYENEVALDEDGAPVLDNEGNQLYDWTDYNSYAKLVFSAVDSTLASIKTDILKEHKFEVSAEDSSAAADEGTTYPVPKAGDEGDAFVMPETEKYVPDEARWPGYYGDVNDKSLGRETMNEFISMIKKRIEDNYQVTKADKAKFAEDNVKINNIINTKGVEYVYPELIDMHYIKFLVGSSALQQVKFERIQEAIEDGIEVEDSEIARKYNEYVAAQKTAYDGDIGAYYAAIKDSATNVFYHPAAGVAAAQPFYVKHILLPFSDVQKKELEAHKVSKDPNIISFRNQLAESLVVYAHKDGEDDKSKSYTVDQVFTEIKSAMDSAKAVVKDAERKFDEFIYKYNTDPGTFDNAKGYIEFNTFPEGQTETYMKEFGDGARALYKNYRVGEVLDYYVVTDYGVHIMYYAGKVEATVANRYVGLEDWQSAGQFKKYSDVLKAEIETKKIEKAYQDWQNERIFYYQTTKKVSEKFEKRFKDLYEV